MVGRNFADQQVVNLTLGIVVGEIHFPGRQNPRDVGTREVKAAAAPMA